MQLQGSWKSLNSPWILIPKLVGTLVISMVYLWGSLIDLGVWRPCPINVSLPYRPIDNIWAMMFVWRLRGNIIRTAACWVMWHNVHSQQHTHMSSSYRYSRLGLSNWDPYAMHRGGCLELYYCNMVEWSWWDSSLIWKTNWFLSVLWHCWVGHITCNNCPRNDLYCVEWDIKPILLLLLLMVYLHFYNIRYIITIHNYINIM